MQEGVVANKKNLISVIIPVYNVEKFLPYCIESVLAQTYTNLEIILVDDGSTDNSSKICDEYKNKDTRIKVVRKQNGGLSSARNAGLDIATGDYIGFVDSDDTILPTMYEKLYNALVDNDAQVSICGYALVDENFKEIKDYPLKSPIKNEVLNTLEIMEKLCVLNLNWYYTIACNKLYDKKIFDKIKFPLGRIHEDEFVSHRVFDLCTKVACVEECMYLYTKRANSITSSTYSIKKLDKMIAFLDRYEFCKGKYEKFSANQLGIAASGFIEGIKHIPYRKWNKEYKKATNKLIRYYLKENKPKQALSIILRKIKYYFKPNKIKGGN